MLKKLDGFFTSGWNFDSSEIELRSKFQMMNIAIVLSSSALLFGISGNIVRHVHDLITLEVALLLVNLVLFFTLRSNKTSFPLVSTIITAQFTFLFLYLVYTSEPSSLKHVWLFTYPIVLLYLQNKKDARYWVSFTISVLLLAPFQPFMEISYSVFQIMYLVVSLSIVSIITYFYQIKMEEVRNLISSQQEQLKNQVDELVTKDQLLSAQSRQAVMGEMISMIAHQWRQPLSTVTLSVSNLQVKKLLGDKINSEDLDKALEDISNTVVYLSNTIDDFQTYFHPNKELTDTEIFQLLNKAINFVLPRLKNTKIYIEIDNESDKEITIQTYVNELIQVVLNILNNAIDALSVLHIDSPKIVISVEEKKETLVINIKDNANGIKEEDLSKIFEPYFSTKGRNGTGLGLYMSQMLVQKQFNGKISVSSSNEGSHFSVEIQKKLF